MRNRILRDWSLGVVLAVLPLSVARAEGLSAPAPDAAPAAEVSALPTANSSASGDPLASADPSDAALASAPVQAISTEKSPPPNVRLSTPVAEVVRLANSGVDQSVVLAYIKNSPDTFNLGAEEIIYLNDIGLPGSDVTAMIQHDQALKGTQPITSPPPPPPAPPANQFANDGVSTPVPPNQYAPTPDSSVPPVEIIPGAAPPDYGTEEDGPPPNVATDSAFYDSLAPYGSWVNVGGYGNCWQPNAGIIDANWQPYFNCGHWVYSDCGWYWLSGYTWGWAPFHYGRWFRHNTLGWCWSPGRVWGPSWVAWRYSAGYCGWAPLPPSAWYSPTLGLTFRGHAVSSTFGFGLTPQSFAFVSFNHFYNSHLPNFAVPNRQVTGFFSTTTFSTAINFSNGRVINNGLPPRTVAASTHTQIQRVSITHISSTSVAEGGRTERFASGGTTLSVFRPVTPQAAGSKASSIARPAPQAHGSPHALNAAPLIMHGSGQAQAGTGATRTPVSGTTWKDIPRSPPTYGAMDESSYQRWRQSVQPGQTPWYLPNTSGASAKTSRADNHQNAGKPGDSDTVAELGSRYQAPANSAAHQWQYSAPNYYQAPRGDYSVPLSFVRRPANVFGLFRHFQWLGRFRPGLRLQRLLRPPMSRRQAMPWRSNLP